MLVTSVMLHRVVIHELLITLFIVMTTPVTAVLLMRTAIVRERHRRGTVD
jgi:multicomponent K+:H+ antiporter subunit G